MASVPESGNNNGSLASQMTKLSDLQVKNARSMFAQPLEFAVGNQSRVILNFEQDPLEPCQLVVELQANDETLELGVGLDLFATALGDQQWDDFDWRSRLLAWTSAHGRLLDALAALFGALVPVRLKKASTASPAANRIWLGLQIEHDGKKVVHGALGMPGSYLSSLLLRRESTPPRDLNSLSLPLKVEIDGPTFDVSGLSGLAVGDILVLGSTEAAFANVKIFPKSGRQSLASGQWSELGLKIAAPNDCKKPSGETNMSEVETSSVAEGDLAAKLPLELTFELGQISVSLARLQRLQPGYVFEIPQPIEGAEIVIAVNGQSIGRGELVAAGETLGVRVLNWDDDGLQ